jgi:hypothetical protein
MKNGEFNANNQDIFDERENASETYFTCDNTFPFKAYKSTMPEQLVKPPARVWERIEKILDQQDEARKSVNNLISASFKTDRSENRKAFIATCAGVSLAVGFFLLLK